MPERVKKLIDFIIENNLKNYQIFNSRNITGDCLITIYNEDNIQVDICDDWGYLEIFGLTDEEYNTLEDTLRKAKVFK